MFGTGVDGKTAHRHTVLFLRADRAEITRTRKGRHVDFGIGLVDDTKAGVAEIGTKLAAIDAALTESEGRRVVGDGCRGALVQFVQMHGPLENETGMKGAYFEAALLTVPQGMIGPVVNALVVGVINVQQALRQFTVVGVVGLRGQGSRLTLELGLVEGLGRRVRQPQRRGV